jgi:hypothetical protein
VAYLRILAEGEVAAGDPVEVVHRPGHGLTVAEVSRIYHDDRAGAARLLEVPELAETGSSGPRGSPPHAGLTRPSGDDVPGAVPDLTTGTCPALGFYRDLPASRSPG